MRAVLPAVASALGGEVALDVLDLRSWGGEVEIRGLFVDRSGGLPAWTFTAERLWVSSAVQERPDLILDSGLRYRREDVENLECFFFGNELSSLLDIDFLDWEPPPRL